jgi:hypothetical protein
MYKLTRYLYELTEVKASLILALLNKDIKQSLYWAFEYYYSGCPYDSTNFIIQIFYDFYYVLNSTFEKYLFVNLKKITLENEREDLALFIKLILENLILRPFTLDVFILRHMGVQFEINLNHITDPSAEIVSSILDINNYIYFAAILMQHIDFNKNVNIEKLHSNVVDVMSKHYKINAKMKKKETATLLKYCLPNEPTLKRTILLSKIVNYFYINKGSKIHRSLYIENDIIVQHNELQFYKTTYHTNLKNVATYNSNQLFMGIFQLERFNNLNIDFKLKYLNNWEFYAFDMPFWNHLFANYHAFKNIDNKKIVFETESDEEQFYYDFQFSPDEESLEVQNLSIGLILKVSDLNPFYEKFGGKNIIPFDKQFIDDLELFIL